MESEATSSPEEEGIEVEAMGLMFLGDNKSKSENTVVEEEDSFQTNQIMVYLLMPSIESQTKDSRKVVVIQEVSSVVEGVIGVEEAQEDPSGRAPTITIDLHVKISKKLKLLNSIMLSYKFSNRKKSMHAKTSKAKLWIMTQL